MPRFKLTIAYDGTHFHGWQKQEPPDTEPLRTVQGVLEEAVRDALHQEVDVLGASRTDAGVHAQGQVAAMSAETSIPLDRMARAISSRLPDDVQVRRAEIVADDFDPIGHATRKMYRYSIAHGGPVKAVSGQPSVVNTLPSPPPLFDRHFLYYTWYRLDVRAMSTAAECLVGRHDFASFAQINHGRSSTERTIFDCSVTSTAHDRCHIEVCGDGFLYNMVRIIAGTLVEVGRGKFGPDDIVRIINARDRRCAGPTLPPEGLCLMWVAYTDPDSAQPA